MRVGMVLSGGGARCFAQLGALRALEEHDLHPAALTACSTSAIIGALIANGLGADEVLERMRDLNLRDLVHVRVGSGVMDSDRIQAWLEQHLPATFEELKLPFGVTAVDIQTAERLEFSSGPLIPAVLGSNAFPGLFHPVLFEGRALMDGGILDEVPVELVRRLTGERVMALDVTMGARRQVDLKRDRNALDVVEDALHKRTPLPVDLMYKAYEITRQFVIDARYQAHPPDVRVRVDLGSDVMTQDFGKLDQAVQAGYDAARRVLERQPGGLA